MGMPEPGAPVMIPFPPPNTKVPDSDANNTSCCSDNGRCSRNGGGGRGLPTAAERIWLVSRMKDDSQKGSQWNAKDRGHAPPPPPPPGAQQVNPPTMHSAGPREGEGGGWGMGMPEPGGPVTIRSPKSAERKKFGSSVA